MHMYLVEMERYLSYFNYHITFKLIIANPARKPLWLSAVARFLASKCGESIKDSAVFICPFIPCCQRRHSEFLKGKDLIGI